MHLYPAFLTESIHELREQLERLAPIVDRLAGVQVDIIDGEFVDNLTISPIDLIGIDFTPLAVDFHLMVNEPISYVYECKQVEGARSVIGQVEHMHSQAEFIAECKELNLRCGLSLDAYTPLEAIDDASWEQLDIIQLMGVEAGAQGQAFKGATILTKLQELVSMKKKRELTVEILIDGGVTPHLLDTLANQGVDGVVVGSALWQSRDIEQTVGTLIG